MDAVDIIDTPPLCIPESRRRLPSVGLMDAVEMSTHFHPNPETAVVRALCTHTFIFLLTPCLRAVGEMLGPVWISGFRLFVFAT